ncbi:MAG TPA: hypothetical protein PKA37_15700, partial [Planctomycetota bacterium]|nr:hypothetical protein [Planctomycetota bacterium]
MEAFGSNTSGQLNVPSLPAGMTYSWLGAHHLQSLAIASGSSQPQIAMVGMGCAGAGGLTVLSSAQSPFLGNSAFSLTIASGAPMSPSYLFLANALAPTPAFVGAGCAILLEPQSLLIFLGAGLSPLGPLSTDATGSSNFLLPIPATPAFAGSTLAFQAAVLDTTIPIGLTLS